MRISNFKFQISNSKGYTLVEMLVVIIIFSVIGGIIAGIFTSSLRGSNKANITNEVRQNGNYALLQISKMITYAKSFEGIKNTLGDDFLADCYVEPVRAGTPTPTPPAYHYLKVSDFEGGSIIFSCNVDTSEIASNGANLIDAGVVKVDSCSFSCSQQKISDAPTIGINFVLSQKGQSSFFEHQASIPFSTSVTMRNASR